MTIPSFGEKQDVTYVNRYGVYAVIPNKDKDQIILVQAQMGLGSCLAEEIEADRRSLASSEAELIEN